MSGKTRLGVVFAGGGTGGHIQPNLAIAEALRAMLAGDISASFVVSDRAIDQKVLDGADVEGLAFDVVVSPAKPIIVRPKGLTRFVWNWGGGVRAGRRAIRDLRERCERVVVAATGGFVSPGVMQAARVEGVPSVLVNLDAKPGKANRLARGWARRALSTAMVEDDRYERVPPIVRARMIQSHDAGDARASFGLDRGRSTLLVTGGSQGAASVNRFVIRALGALRDEIDLGAWQVLHQCGSGDGSEDECRNGYEAIGVRAEVRAYIERMDLAFAASECVIARGGAGAMADVWATRTPGLVLPYPFHRDQHQRLNAKELASAGGVVIATDRVDPDVNVREHLDAMRRLLDPKTRREMSVALESLGPASGAVDVASVILALAGVSTPGS